MHNTSPAHDSRSAGHADSGIRIVKEKVGTLICFARELHGVTIGNLTYFTSIVRKDSQLKLISRSHRGTDGIDSLLQSLWSFEKATSICALV